MGLLDEQANKKSKTEPQEVRALKMTLDQGRKLRNFANLYALLDLPCHVPADEIVPIARSLNLPYDLIYFPIDYLPTQLNNRSGKGPHKHMSGYSRDLGR